MTPRVRHRGSALLVVVAIGILLTATVWSGLSVLATEASVSMQEARADDAREAAEAGLQWAILALERDRGYAGEKAHAFGSGQFDVTVEPVPARPEARRVRVTGRVPGTKTLPVTSTFVAVLERVETPKGPVWRRIVWRIDSSTR